MPNPTGAGTEFATVKFNKSYGQHGSRGRGSMVVLSRPQKAGPKPKLSVPPPLNLPSLRKEHQKFDSLGSGGGGGDGSESGSRPSSSDMGWTKPASVTLPVPEKATLLRGEDFPSLRATLSSSSGVAQKPKEKELSDDSLFMEQKGGSRLSDVDSLSRGGVSNGFSGNHNDTRTSFGGSQAWRKQEECFPGPLPLVRLNPRSDWADDERDTSHGLMNRNGEGRGYEPYWDRDFDMTRVGISPNKWGQGSNDTGQFSSGEVSRLDPYVKTSNRDEIEGHYWRNSSFSKDGFGVQYSRNERNGVGSSLNRETWKNNKYVRYAFRDNFHDDPENKDKGYVSSDQHNNRNGVGSVQNSGGKRLPVNDPLHTFANGKGPVKSEKDLLEDTFAKDFGASGFDGRDLLPTGLVGVVKKKDVSKQTDFHDPVRESFEAELKRVQRTQEQERQRIIEEHGRALELARKEEEERLRQAGEQEERQRRLEEEARNAAWRAEQERIEALMKAEEQRLTREEEKHMLHMEEERRKQAAKQKLLELDQKIARRQAEAAKGGNNDSPAVVKKIPGFVKEKDVSRVTEVGDWDGNGERMVERIITSASPDSASVNRPLEIGSGHNFSWDISATYADKGKPVNSRRREFNENVSNSVLYLQDHDNACNSISPCRDSSITVKPFMRKEYNGGARFMSSRTYYKGGVSDSRLDEYAHIKGQRGNPSGEGDHIRKARVDSDFHENFVERFDDGRLQSRAHDNPFPPYPEHSSPNSESYGPHALGISRYSVKQPQVLPSTLLATVHKTYRNGNEHPGPFAFLENEVQYEQVAYGESTMPSGYHKRIVGQPAVVDAMEATTENKDHEVETTLTCDSQSSLSVSNPPSSPAHLSHDDLDESRDSPLILVSKDGKNGALSGPENESVVISARAQNENAVTSTFTDSNAADDEWTTDNNEQFQEPEEYDEDEDYQDEVHEGDDNIDLNQEFEDVHLQEKGLPLVLGFDEGVQVGMPNEEFERSLKDEETSFMAQQASINTIEEHISFENGIKALLSNNDSYAMNLNNSSSVFQESEKPTQDLVIRSINAHSSLESKSLGNEEASKNGLSAHYSVPISSTITPRSSLGQNLMSNVATAPSQAELPVKLQFGLFSGPSLIPSPVPAIQIGSIQMPLHLHTQVSAPLSHIHPSQPLSFQFGQLRYTSPISQGIMPQGSQSMSFVQRNIPSDFNFNHKSGGQMPTHSGSDTSDFCVKNEIRPLSVDNQTGKSRHSSHGSLPSENAENVDGIKQGQIGVLSDGNNCARTAASFRVDKHDSQNFVGKNSNTSFNAIESESETLSRDASFYSISKEKDFIESKAQFPVPSSRGKRYVSTVKMPGSRSSGPAPRVNHLDSRGYLRRPQWNNKHIEFQVHENNEKRQSSGSILSDQFGSDNKSNISRRGMGVSGRTGPRKTSSKKLGKQTAESTTENFHQVDSRGRAELASRKEYRKTQSISHYGQSNHKRNLCSDEDVDTPLQSGIIRVFEQLGIEAPSDEDDFIEVRSKRQMLNNRRQQREKDIKAKSQVAKMRRKTHPNLQNAVALAKPSKGFISSEVANGDHPHVVAAEGHRSAKVDVSSEFDLSVMSQPLAPIGTPPLKIDAQSDLTSQTSRLLETSLPAVSGGGKGPGPGPGPGVVFESNSKVDKVQPLGSWGNALISPQVMPLTQTQLDIAMKPQQFDSQASVRDLASAVKEPSLPSSSLLTKEKAYSSVSSPINSLLAGEKIQFGAVTSPTVLPSSSRSVSHGIGSPQSSISDMQKSHNLDGPNNHCNLFFDEKKHINESCGQLEDCEAEAEAAASAVAAAAAAISSDEIVGNGLGTCSVSLSNAKSFVAANINGIGAGIASEQQSAVQSRSKEPLGVSLPADLSVETPPISLWPPLPSQQNSSNQMISHFPAGPPHFPFYEMNPMMGGPVFAFGPHDESASTVQSQPQISTTSASRPIGSWHQCHSSMDSFYGPPTGFSGPFITPPGGMPGIQGPPHMVVYNHFAPVGQFGQVSLSLMGTTYIPSGKQPDWKHTPTTSAMGADAGDINMNMASCQRDPANMPSPIQHITPGSPLLSMASPLTMFDVSPFQSSEMSVQARWPHVPNSQLPSIPLSMPSHQQGVHTSQYSSGPSVDQSLNVNRYMDSQTSTSDVNVNRLPDELGLVDSNSIAARVSVHSDVNKTPYDAAKADVQNGNSSNGNNQHANSAIQSQPSQQSSVPTQQQLHGHSSGYTNNYQRRGSISQRHGSGGEWSHRRKGFQGRNQSSNADKSFSSSKVKQIYVAKQTVGHQQYHEGI